MTIERQVIACWYTPKEKMPPEGKQVLVTASCTCLINGKEHLFERWMTFAELTPFGWRINIFGRLVGNLTVHAWCDIEPYRG